MKLNQPIREIQHGLDQKRFSSVELTKAYLDAVQKSKHGAYLLVCEERALKQARASDELLAKDGASARISKPLLGIPLALKDNLTLDGVKTTCASKILENYIPPYTATAVARLEAAGAITLGKLNMDEFAMGGSNENSAFGAVQHPTHPGRVPGGSSGGSATAVRAQLCAAALGSDTGGSIRLPAHFCGVVGVKPTYGRISRYGLVAFASSLDQIGPLTQNVEDAALLLEVMSGHDPLDSTSSTQAQERLLSAVQTPTDFKGKKIGVAKEYFIGGLQTEVARDVESSLKWFEKQGAKLIPISLPHTQYSVAVYYLIALAEASSNLARFDSIRYGTRPAEAEIRDLAEFYKKARSKFGPEVKRRIMLGTFALSSGYSEAYYQRACQVRRLIQEDFTRAFEHVDFIAGPVSPTTAFKIGEQSSDPLTMYLNDIFTIPANLAGLPALSIPCGKDSQELPIGLHLMAPAFKEASLLSLAAGFERRSS